MKKLLSVWLAIGLMVFASVSLAESLVYEEITIDISALPYDSEAWVLEAYGISLQLPEGWVNYTDEIEQQEGGMTFLFGEAEGEAGLSIDIVAVDLSNSSYESIAEGLVKNGMTDVSVKIINDFKYIYFMQEDDLRMGAVLPSLDGAITFYYAPIDDASYETFTAILSTFVYGDFITAASE